MWRHWAQKLSSADALKKAAIGAFLLFGILIVTGYSFARDYLLPVSAIMSTLTISELNLPKRVLGQKNAVLNLSLSMLGGLIQALIGFVEFGILLLFGVTAVYVVLTPLILSVFLWRKVDWSPDQLRGAFTQVIEKEKKDDPTIKRKKVVIWSRIELTSIEYIKMLVFFSLTFKAFVIAAIISFLVAFLGYVYVLEYSMFALFVLWGFVVSLDASHAKWRDFLKTGEKQETKLWTLLFLSLSTLKGVCYMFLLLASAFFACVGVVLLAVLFFGVIFSAFVNFTGSLPSLMTLVQGILVWFSALALVAYLVYPIYVLMKLYEALILNASGRKKHEVRLLPLSGLCLLISIMFSYIVVFDLYALDTISIMLYFLMAVAWAPWFGVLWMRHRGRYSALSGKTEKMLGLGLGAYSFPFYSFLEQDIVIVPLLLAAIYVCFKWLSSLSDVSKKEEKKRVYLTICFFVVVFLFLFFKEEFRGLTPLPFAGILACALLLLPKKYRDKITEKLFLMREVET